MYHTSDEKLLTSADCEQDPKLLSPIRRPTLRPLQSTPEVEGKPGFALDHSSLDNDGWFLPCQPSYQATAIGDRSGYYGQLSSFFPESNSVDSSYKSTIDRSSSFEASDSESSDVSQLFSSFMEPKPDLELNLNSYFNATTDDKDFSKVTPSEMRASTLNKDSLVMERVQVPSSQHVAEIVGKKGSMIRELRERTNTYIRTPLLGEQPEFLISGSTENVAEAKKEILKLSQHFTDLRFPTEETARECKITVKFHVPYASVGLVVGHGGTNIKRIRSMTGTLIVTPKPLQDPIFIVKGPPANVHNAIMQIEGQLRKNKASSRSRDAEEMSAKSLHDLSTLKDNLEQILRKRSESSKSTAETCPGYRPF